MCAANTGPGRAGSCRGSHASASQCPPPEGRASHAVRNTLGRAVNDNLSAALKGGGGGAYYFILMGGRGGYYLKVDELSYFLDTKPEVQPDCSERNAATTERIVR